MYSQHLALLLAVTGASATPWGRFNNKGHHDTGNPTSVALTSTAVPSTTSVAAAVATPSSSSTSSAAAAATSAVSTNDNSGTATTSSATQYCGAPNSYEIISDTPWIVYSMNYNYQDISGSCCTGYYEYTGSDENQTIHWNSVWEIDESVNTDVVKGYSFIGLTQNLETTLDSISSIPSTYDWTVSNTTAYKGKTSSPIFCLHTSSFSFLTLSLPQATWSTIS